MNAYQTPAPPLDLVKIKLMVLAVSVMVDMRETHVE